MRCRFALPAALVLLATGCGHDCFVLELTPDGDGFHRQLTAWQVPGSEDDIIALSEDERERLTKIYGSAEAIENGTKHVFAARFTGSTPADIGGYGSWQKHTSPLGSWTTYDERFRGSADLDAELEKRRAAADRLVDLSIGWLRAEIGGEADFKRIEELLDKQLRADLRNLAVYAWTCDAFAQGSEQRQMEFAFRFWQYLREQGYVRSEELPGLARALADADDDPQPLLSVLERILARKLGVADDQPVPVELASLADPERLQKSLEDYLRKTDEYKQLLERWKAEHADRPNAKEPEPGEVAGNLLVELLGLGWGQTDKLEIRLNIAVEPFHTNGQWDAEAQVLSWDLRLQPNSALPAFAYATWSEPDAAFQKTHFGRVLLDAKALGEYVLWYQGLDAAEADAWDGFIEQCRPGTELPDRIDAFRLPSGEGVTAEEDGEEGPDTSQTGRRLLLNALGDG